MGKQKYKEEDLIDRRFKKLIVKEIFRKKKDSGKLEKFANCFCDCGNSAIVNLYNLLSGNTISCGCAKGISKRREGVLGNKYGRWIVVDDSLKSVDGKRFVAVRCSCEKQTVKNVWLNSLKMGKSNSCGCIKEENSIGDRTRTHGLTRHPIYALFNKIIDRCENEKFSRYKDWGGRGIKICDEWRNDFQVFYNWCLNNGWKKGLQIDRINNDGSYSPDNCRFLNNQDNSFNQRLIKTNNTSGYRGVSFQNQTGYYGAYVRFNGATIFYVGKFSDAKSAALARDKFIIKNNLPHKLNFPELAINGPL